MATREQVLGNWNQIKGIVKEQWGQLSDRELDDVKGNIDQLIGLVQKKTGESRHQIERFLDQLSEDAGGAFVHATDKAREYANQAADRLRDATDQVSEQAREGYEAAQSIVRRHPAEAVAVAFGTGLVVGVIVGLTCRSR
jgi:uncharacterized protein YjbJ (UPF0337 family)